MGRFAIVLTVILMNSAAICQGRSILRRPRSINKGSDSYGMQQHSDPAGIGTRADMPTIRSGAVSQVARSGSRDASQALKLLFGAGGIYAAFLYYGSLQEDVFRYMSAEGETFREVWFLQVLEALFNVVVGFCGLALTGPTKGLPQKLFACTGFTQVGAKYCTNAALANGLSFPVATLAKSAKMVPVMLGSLILGGASYSPRQYAQVAAIVCGTAVVSLSKKKVQPVGQKTGVLGFTFILSSLAFDGLTGGVQKRVKFEAKRRGLVPKPYDYMFWTNTYMLLTALLFALFRGELVRGTAFCVTNPSVLTKIMRFAACSACGQSFIFYTIANFDPLVTTTVTTTRKIFSVLLSIFIKGHSLNLQGWVGLFLACSGILSDIFFKDRAH